MVKLNYFSKKKANVNDESSKKHNVVKGLAKKIFGSFRVGDSMGDENISLSTIFNIFNEDIGTIDVKKNCMYLHKQSYQKEAKRFAEAYKKEFMNDNEEFVINFSYSE
jgi:hypothetical protein